MIRHILIAVALVTMGAAALPAAPAGKYVDVNDPGRVRPSW
jgi:hypothetical protein